MDKLSIGSFFPARLNAQLGHYMLYVKRFSVFYLIACCPSVYAQYITLPTPVISGFLNAGVTSNDNETAYLGYKDSTSFQNDTLLGIQVDAQIYNTVRTSAQIIAKETAGNFELEAEWGYIGYTVNPSLEIKAGRLRVPAFMFSETIHIGVSYPWVRTPTEVYNLFQTTKLHGIDLTYSIDSRYHTLYIQPYIGEIHSSSFSGSQSVRASTDEFYGVRAQLEAPNYEITAGLVHAKGFLNISSPSLTTVIDVNFDMFTLGFQTEIHDFEFIAEFVKNQNQGTSNPDASGWYASLIYQHGRYSPYISVAGRDEKLVGNRKASNLSESRSVSLGIRLDVSPGSALTLELHHAEALNDSAGAFGDPLGLSIVPEDHTVNLITCRFDAVF